MVFFLFFSGFFVDGLTYDLWVAKGRTTVVACRFMWFTGGFIHIIWRKLGGNLFLARVGISGGSVVEFHSGMQPGRQPLPRDPCSEVMSLVSGSQHMVGEQVLVRLSQLEW